MATPLKNYYNDRFFDFFSSVFSEVYTTFDGKKFKEQIYAGEWEKLELKERMRKTADVLASMLPKDFKEAAQYIQAFADHYHASNRSGFGFELMFVCDFVERYGIDDVETAIQTMEKTTTLSSAEFAVRPFLNKYPERMMKQMNTWSKHPHELVRRLSTEGFRPRLPWGLAVPYLKKDPSPVFEVLESLKDDASENVRRSVANNLNDISKDHPEKVLEVLTRWKKNHPETERVIKHASRTLLKQGHQEILELFGSSSSEYLSFMLVDGLTSTIRVNEAQAFSFQIHHTGKTEQKIRVEYVIYFLLNNGKHGKKVFFITEKILQPGQNIQLKKSHTFKPITTRTYYEGLHKMAVLVNGKEYGLGEFNLRFN